MAPPAGSPGFKNQLLLAFLRNLHRAPGLRAGLLGGVAIFASGFLLGLWGWIRETPSPPRGDELFYWEQQIEATRSLLTDLVLAAGAPARWQLQGARWTVPLLVLFLAAVASGRLFPNRLQVWLTTSLSSFNCVYGSGKLALQLSRDQRERGTGPLAIAPNDESRAGYRKARLPVIRARERARLERAVAGNVVIAADESDLANAELSEELFRSSGDRRPRRILARINNFSLRTQLSDHYGAALPASDTGLTLFSTLDLHARNCLREFPLDRFKLAARPSFSHALVVGYQEMGEAMVLTLLKSSHFAHGEPVRVTVVDRDSQSRRSEFEARFPEAFSHRPPAFEPANRTNGGVPYELLSRLDTEGNGPTAIFVCISDPSVGVSVGLDLLKQHRFLGAHLPPIYVIAADANPGSEDSVLDLLDLGHGGMMRVTRAEIEIVDGELLLQERLDKLAERSHERYLEDRRREKGFKIGALPSYYHWPQLPESFKEDNREQADHHWLKLRDIGCVVTREPSKVEFSREEIEALAMSEHNRWLAARKIRGWRHGPDRNDPARIHPDMVPWDALPEDSRKKSRKTIRRLPKNLALIGHCVQRSVFVRIVAAGSALPSREALESYRSGIQARCPGKRLVVVSELSTEAERGICRVLCENGAAALVLLLPRPVYEVVAALPPSARARFTELARRATRIVAGVDSRQPDPLPIVGSYPSSETRSLLLGVDVPSISRADRIVEDGSVRWADEA